METCTVETGLLRKKPCGHPSVAHCANCEQPLCKDHAVAQVNPARQRTGKFMCKLCDQARREYEQNAAPAAAPAKMPEAAPAAAPAAAPPAEAKAAPPEKKSDDGGIDFVPEKKK